MIFKYTAFRELTLGGFRLYEIQRGRWDLAVNVAVREVDSLCHGKLLQCIRYALRTRALGWN